MIHLYTHSHVIDKCTPICRFVISKVAPHCPRCRCDAPTFRVGSAETDCYKPPVGLAIPSPTNSTPIKRSIAKSKRSKVSSVTQDKASSQSRTTQLPSVEGYVEEVGVKQVLGHICNSHPDSILKLPPVVRERTTAVKAKAAIITAREHRVQRDLRQKLTQLRAQLTKSTKRQTKAEGLAVAAKTRLVNAKAEHAAVVKTQHRDCIVKSKDQCQKVCMNVGTLCVVMCVCVHNN